MSKYAILLALFSAIVLAQAPGNRDGEVRAPGTPEFQAWNAETGEWQSPVAFWESYAARRGGLTWGRGTEYPEYAKVKEFDTFLVLVEQGPCLMEFFHSRWRRANDVRRWDPAFNDDGGCPNVFD